jgi:hypothetical protein
MASVDAGFANRKGPSHRASIAADYLQKVLDLHDGVIETRRLKWIGAGGTHLVFVESEKSQDYVIKVARQNSLAEDHSTQSKVQLGGEADLDDALDRYFPAEWLAASHASLVPVVMLDGTFRPEATVLVQRYDSNFLNEDRVGIECGYPELAPANSEAAIRYRSVNTLLTGQWSSRAIGDLAACFPGLTKIARLAIEDPGFNGVLARLVAGTERIVAETCQIIDLVGNDNVFFYRAGRNWTCRIGSVVKQDSLDRLKGLLARPELFDSLTNPDLAQVINGLAFVRLTNFLSLLSAGKISIDLALSDQGLEMLARRFESGIWLDRLTGHLKTLDLQAP